MKNICYLFFLLLTACANPSSDKTEDVPVITRSNDSDACLRGAVVDKSGTPLSGARFILLYEHTLLEGGKTDDKGYFEVCPNQDGQFTLKVAHEGYQGVEQQVDFKMGNANTLRLELTAN